MERWDRSRRGGRGTAAANNNNPSFSSILLDAIYRSIDEGGGGETGMGADERSQLQGGAPDPTTLTRKKHLHHHNYYFQRAAFPGGGGENEKYFTGTTTAVVERKKSTTVTEKVVLRRRDVSEYDEHHSKSPPQQHQYRKQQRDRLFLNSTSSSSESSCGGFSSSEAESVVLSAPRPKPIRTGAPPARPDRRSEERMPEGNKPKSEGSIRSRFRASKIYGELKKAKSPVSPGGRLASFLNTLFASAGNPKKAKISTAPVSAATGGGGGGGAGGESTCSSASSYSRSCLSKTPSSRGKTGSSNGGVKRSVRFYPVSVIVDEDSRPCGQKCLYGKNDDYNRWGAPTAAVRVREASYLTAAEEERKRAAQAARNLIRGYQEKKRGFAGFGVEEEDDDDDAGSCSSSDLFELENLAAIGSIATGGDIGDSRYRDELPVYETTHLGTNRAIAQGLIL